jgi:predicted kinase
MSQFCPNFKLEETKNTFNSIVSVLDGTPLDNNQFDAIMKVGINTYLVDKPNEYLRLIKATYKVYNETEGSNDKIKEYFEALGIDYSFDVTNKSLNTIALVQNQNESIKNSKTIEPTILLPIGTSGSGKSTFIKTLPKDKYTIISPDEMRVEFTGNMDDKSKDKEIYEAVKERAIQAVKNGKSVIIDTTNLQKDRRRDFINAINSVLPNTKIEYKLLELNPELARQRIKSQIERGENRANVPDSTIDRHALLYKEMLEDIKSENISKFQEPLTSEQSKNINDLKSIEPAYANYNNEQIQAFIDSKIPDRSISLDLKERDGWKWIKLNAKNIGEVKLVKNDRQSKEVGLSIKINEEFQNKGYGQIVHRLVADWAKNEFGDLLYSDFDNSKAEINMLLSLVKKGYAEQVSNYGKEEDGRFNTEERAFKIKTTNDILSSPETIREFKEFVGKQSSNTESFSDAEIEAMIQSGEITFTEDDGKLCAKMGMKSDKFTSGGKWEMISSIKGKSHNEGGVDLTINDNGKVTFKNKLNNDIKAEFGLVISGKSIT